MNKPLRRIAIFCGLLVLALLVRDNWIQFAQSEDLKTDPKNRRVAIARYAKPRGNIIVDGKSITGSKKNNSGDFKYKRTYNNGKMWAPVTGYASQAFGANQLEALNDGILSGDDDRLWFNRTADMLSGKPQKGGNVVTTLNSKAQKAAYEGLGDRKGAVAAINPKTGAILALANKPSYDPTKIAGNSKADTRNWTGLQKKNNPGDPMLNRALRATYPPGSTFKLVTAAAGLESGKYDLDKRTDSPDPYTLPDSSTKLKNEGDIPTCKNATVREALKVSCNTVFAKMSAELGNAKMKETAEKFGYNNKKLDTPVRTAPSLYPKDNKPQNAMAGIGQASNAATPLQMAMVSSAIANDGKLMKPYMVDQLRAPNLNVVQQHTPTPLNKKDPQTLSSENAQKLQDAMETVVNDPQGTGGKGKIPGYTVGGKTGTAQHGENNSKSPYAWFVSYAKDKDDSSPIAVATVIESSAAKRSEVAGGELAAPVSKSVMEAVLKSNKQ